MKLAEALIRRADCQKRIEQLKGRLQRSVKVQEGDQPPEDPQELLAELDRLAEEFTELVQRINRTNSSTEFAPGKTVSDVLAERDGLTLRRNVLAAALEEAAVRQVQFTRSEVKFVSTINVAELQKQVDALAQQHRELDSRIQESNWRVDLLEQS